MPQYHFYDEIEQIFASPLCTQYSKIDTPEKFVHFVAGTLDASDTDAFIVTAGIGAYGGIFRYPNLLADSKYDSVHFRTFDGSYIAITPASKIACADFRTTYTFSLAGMPAHYTTYNMQFDKDVEVRPADIRQMAGWTQATKMAITGNSDVGARLQRYLRKLTSLKEVTVSVANVSFTRLSVEAFVKALPSLEKASFVQTPELTDGRFDQFVRSQTVPTGWTVSRNEDGIYTVQKKH